MFFSNSFSSSCWEVPAGPGPAGMLPVALCSFSLLLPLTPPPQRGVRSAAPRLLAGGSGENSDDGSSGGSGGEGGESGGDGWDMSLLQQRMQQQQMEEMMTAASNWRTGTCEQKTLLVLDDWVRRLQCENGLVACGTHSGTVILADVASLG